MVVRYIVCAVVAALGLVMSSAVVKASCPRLTPDEQFASSTAVFVGRATAQRVVPTTQALGGRATETTFEVEDVWKGASAPTQRVQTCGFAAPPPETSLTCSDSVRFVVGERYVVFISGTPLEASTCLPTEQIDRAAQILQWLSGKPHRTPR